MKTLYCSYCRGKALGLPGHPQLSFCCVAPLAESADGPPRPYREERWRGVVVTRKSAKPYVYYWVYARGRLHIRAAPTPAMAAWDRDVIVSWLWSAGVLSRRPALNFPDLVTPGAASCLSVSSADLLRGLLRTSGAPAMLNLAGVYYVPHRGFTGRVLMAGNKPCYLPILSSPYEAAVARDNLLWWAQRWDLGVRGRRNTDLTHLVVLGSTVTFVRTYAHWLRDPSRPWVSTLLERFDSGLPPAREEDLRPLLAAASAQDPCEVPLTPRCRRSLSREDLREWEVQPKIYLWPGSPVAPQASLASGAVQGKNLVLSDLLQVAPRSEARTILNDA